MMRSWLTVAAEALSHAAAVNADADRLVIDLAGCEPGGEDRARQMLGDFLAANASAAILARLCVRIHDFACGHAEADLAAVIPHGVKLVVLPQASNGAAVQRLDVCLSVAEVRAGRKPGETRILAISGDTPSGLLQAAGFAGKSQRLCALGWDAAALAGRIGARQLLTDNGSWSAPMAMARSTLLLTAADCGAAAVDTDTPPCPPDVFARLCREARADGFVGKMTRDIGQLATINALFGSYAGED
jgi:citrate lyase subunit beta/citryl-CoA lyase